MSTQEHWSLWGRVIRWHVLGLETWVSSAWLEKWRSIWNWDGGTLCFQKKVIWILNYGMSAVNMLHGTAWNHDLTCLVAGSEKQPEFPWLPSRGKRHCRSGWQRRSLPAGRRPHSVPGLWGRKGCSSWGGEKSCERDGPESISAEVSGPSPFKAALAAVVKCHSGPWTDPDMCGSPSHVATWTTNKSTASSSLTDTATWAYAPFFLLRLLNVLITNDCVRNWAH